MLRRQGLLRLCRQSFQRSSSSGSVSCSRQRHIAGTKQGLSSLEECGTKASSRNFLYSTSAAKLQSSTETDSRANLEPEFLAKMPRKALKVSLAASQQGRTYFDVLLERVPRSQAAHYLVALDEDSNKLFSLQDKVSTDLPQVTFLTLHDQRAQQALVWNAAFLLEAALQSVYGQDALIAGPSQSQLDGMFAVQVLIRKQAASASPNISKAGDAFEECINVINENAAHAATTLREMDLEVLETKMRDLAGRLTIQKRETSEKIIEEWNTNPFKREEYESKLKDRTALNIFKSLESAHLVDAEQLSANIEALRNVKLLDKATATWKPVRATRANVPSAQAIIRIRGIVCPTAEMLKARLQSMEKARELDHRTIGQAQRLFFTHESSPGTPFILPHGMRIITKVERVIRDLYRKWGYDEVLTPQVFKADLWKQSGHWDNYRDDMFAVEGFKERDHRAQLGTHLAQGCNHHDREPDHDHTHQGDDEAYGLKPMNCPGHCLLFASQEHSFRDLPIRYAEFSPLHRNEASGALSGLTRVRRFHQDDAHVFCRQDQISGEIVSMLAMLREAYHLFGFQQFELVLSTRPPQFLGEIEDWNQAEDALKQALDDSGLSWSINEADGAFYGPKIDIRLIDAAGRQHQTATIQLDFQLPRRFKLKYAAQGQSSPGQENRAAPVMIHRAILGSAERFMAILIESLGGRWPFWLSPRQAAILPTNPDDPLLAACALAVRDVLALGGVVEEDYAAKAGASEAEQAGINEAVRAFLQRSGFEVAKKSSPPSSAELTSRTARASHTFHIDVDATHEKLGKRVRRAHLDRVNFTCVIGAEEIRTGKLQVRSRDSNAADDAAAGRPFLRQDMGAFSIRDLRDLFVRLDDHHW